MGKTAGRAVRALGQGKGTAIPGKLTLALDPGALGGLVADLARGAVLVTGTNGKDTTCRMLANIVRAAGLHPVLNTTGSTGRSGLASAMVARASRAGRLPADPGSVGLFNVSADCLPEILRQVGEPAAIVVTNLFRDQVDGYFEPAYVTVMLERAMRDLPVSTTLVLNADDPRVAFLAPDLKNPRLYFGMADSVPGRPGTDPTSEFPAARAAAANSAMTVSSTPTSATGGARRAVWPGRNRRSA